jgi:hypothetical protein
VFWALLICGGLGQAIVRVGHCIVSVPFPSVFFISLICFVCWPLGFRVLTTFLHSIPCYAILGFDSTMSAHKVRLFALLDNCTTPELVGWCACEPNESYFDFRARLQAANCMDWSFEFFDFDKGCSINPRFEKLDTIGTCVYVKRVSKDLEADRSKRRLVEAIGTSGVAPDVDHAPAIVPDVVEIEAADLSEPPTISRINGENVQDVNHNDLKSVLLAKEVEVKYVRKGDKLRKELEQLNLNNYLWHLKSWDDKDIPIVKLH